MKTISANKLFIYDGYFISLIKEFQFNFYLVHCQNLWMSSKLPWHFPSALNLAARARLQWKRSFGNKSEQMKEYRLENAQW